LRAEIRGSALDAGKISGGLGMQNVLNGVSMAVGVMEKALYSSYTLVDRGYSVAEVAKRLGMTTHSFNNLLSPFKYEKKFTERLASV